VRKVFHVEHCTFEPHGLRIQPAWPGYKIQDPGDVTEKQLVMFAHRFDMIRSPAHPQQAEKARTGQPIEDVTDISSHPPDLAFHRPSRPFAGSSTTAWARRR
jgi:hypothetical protein